MVVVELPEGEGRKIEELTKEGRGGFEELRVRMVCACQEEVEAFCQSEVVVPSLKPTT